MFRRAHFCITYLAQRGNKGETNKKTSVERKEAKQKKKRKKGQKGKKKRKFCRGTAQVQDKKRVGAVTTIANWLRVQGFNLQKVKTA